MSNGPVMIEVPVCDDCVWRDGLSCGETKAMLPCSLGRTLLTPNWCPRITEMKPKQEKNP